MDLAVDQFVMEELLEVENTTWSSSSSDEFDDDTDTPRSRSTRIVNYMDVTDAYSEKEFKEHFRLSRSTIQKLIDGYTPMLPGFRGGWPSISAKKAIYIAIWYLANTESFRQVADRFNVTLSSAHRVVKSVVQYLVDISAEYIKWPSEHEAWEEEKQFEKKKGLKHIIGALDGSHIKILRPTENGEDYINRKGYHSILLQGIVNSKKMFISVKSGEPGSMHDARMLRRSQIYKVAEQDCASLFFGKYCLLGDSAYPSLQWLVTPYKDNGLLTNEQRQYNYRHSASRIVIEHAFGLLKGRFRRLRQFENIDQKFITNCIVAACVLHNVCILFNDNFDEVFQDNIDNE